MMVKAILYMNDYNTELGEKWLNLRDLYCGPFVTGLWMVKLMKAK